MFPVKLLSLCFGLLISGLPAIAQGTFRSELLHIREPIHIRFDLEKAEKAGFQENHGEAWEPKGVFRIAPESSRSLPHMNIGHVYDLRELMRGWGLDFPAGSYAFFSPKSELLFLRLNTSDMELAKACLEPRQPPPREVSFDIQITGTRAEKPEQVLFSGKGIGTRPGGSTKLTSAGGEAASIHKVELTVEAVIGPDERRAWIGLEGSIIFGPNQGRISTDFETAVGKEWTTEMSWGAEKVILRLTPNVTYVGQLKLLENEEAKKRAMDDIEAKLLKVK